jgi:predicted enzyme related to lactoylglutathione lyase
MVVNGLIEVILYVQDMGSQVAFYRDVMGLAVLYPTGLSEYDGEMWVTFNTGSCTLALHGGGKGRLGEDTPKIVFGVPDVEVARTQLHNMGVEMGDIRSAAPGVFVCDGVDPEGNTFSIESHSS